MSLSRQFKVSPVLQDGGAPVAFSPNADGSVPRIWVRRIGAKDTEYQKVMERIMAPHRQADALGALPDKLNEQLRIEIFAEGGIAKWENVLLSDVTGKPTDVGFVDYTKANAIALLNALPELYTELVTFGVQRSNYLEANLESDAKN